MTDIRNIAQNDSRNIARFARTATAAAGLAVALFAGASVMGSGTAQAYGLHLHVGHGYGKHKFFRPRVIVPFYIGSGRSCRWLKVKAMKTGSAYWYNRYYACRGL